VRGAAREGGPYRDRTVREEDDGKGPASTGTSPAPHFTRRAGVGNGTPWPGSPKWHNPTGNRGHEGFGTYHQAASPRQLPTLRSGSDGVPVPTELILFHSGRLGRGCLAGLPASPVVLVVSRVKFGVCSSRFVVRRRWRVDRRPGRTGCPSRCAMASWWVDAG